MMGLEKYSDTNHIQTYGVKQFGAGGAICALGG